MKRVRVGRLVVTLSLGLLCLACSATAPEATRASPGVPAATSTPAAAFAPTGASASADTPAPAAGRPATNAR
jgi:hypothetical protein